MALETAAGVNAHKSVFLIDNRGVWQTEIRATQYRGVMGVKR